VAFHRRRARNRKSDHAGADYQNLQAIAPYENLIAHKLQDETRIVREVNQQAANCGE
jgi:hypothetical protein